MYSLNRNILCEQKNEANLGICRCCAKTVVIQCKLYFHEGKVIIFIYFELNDRRMEKDGESISYFFKPHLTNNCRNS